MNQVLALIREIETQGGSIEASSDELLLRIPESKFADELEGRVRKMKAELLSHLKAPWLIKYPELRPKDVIVTWFPNGSVDVCRKDGKRAVYIPASRLHKGSANSTSYPERSAEEWDFQTFTVGTDVWVLGTCSHDDLWVCWRIEGETEDHLREEQG